jgi:uncharacterized NAD-dependent epimerase/dehydratase family protein
MMMNPKNTHAIVYCEGSFNTPNGKTAHGLVRFSRRFNILSIIDSKYHGEDSGMILDGKPNHIPIETDLEKSVQMARENGITVSALIIGLAPDGGRMPQSAIPVIEKAIKMGMDVYSGLHDFLSDNKSLTELSKEHHCRLIDIRKPPARQTLHFFSGKIEQVDSFKIALLGTDSAVGKRTTAWLMVQAFKEAGYASELIGTGQTAWLQGAEYSIVMDSLVNDFVSGEIEHVIYQAWKNEHPDVLILEGQGSLLNPAYPGGFELMAAGRPDIVVLQHAPMRIYYDGFPGYRIQNLNHQIQAIEIISGTRVRAVTINHEGMQKDEIGQECRKILKETGVPAFDVLEHGARELVEFLKPELVS